MKAPWVEVGPSGVNCQKDKIYGISRLNQYDLDHTISFLIPGSVLKVGLPETVTWSLNEHSFIVNSDFDKGFVIFY